MNRIHLGAILIVTATMMVTGVPFTPVAESADMHHVSGEIVWVDVKFGKLQLKDDATPRTDEITEYRITEHETRVTSPSDRNFLSIKDLYPGQYVTIEVMTGKEDQIVQKITTAFRPRAGYQEAYGRVQTIDEAGTLVLLERPPAGEAGEGNPISFVFYPKEIVVMRSPSRRPVQLLLKPGDVVKVEYVWHDEERQARTITVYSPQISSTTTTVTTTTTNTEGY